MLYVCGNTRSNNYGHFNKIQEAVFYSKRCIRLNAIRMGYEKGRVQISMVILIKYRKVYFIRNGVFFSMLYVWDVNRHVFK